MYIEFTHNKLYKNVDPNSKIQNVWKYNAYLLKCNKCFEYILEN